MANLSGFDASKVEPAGVYEALPAGDYQVIITESEMKPTKSGTGRYLQLKLQVINGKFQNRTLFDRLNLDNPNDTAVQIAKATLSSICRAVNVLTPQDSSELHNKPLTAKVSVRKDDNGNPQNEIKGYTSRAPYTQTAAPEGVNTAADVDSAPW